MREIEWKSPLGVASGIIYEDHIAPQACVLHIVLFTVRSVPGNNTSMKGEWLSSLSVSFTAYTIDVSPSSHPCTFQHGYGIHSIVPESSEKFLLT